MISPSKYPLCNLNVDINTESLSLTENVTLAVNKASSQTVWSQNLHLKYHSQNFKKLLNKESSQTIWN